MPDDPLAPFLAAPGSAGVFLDFDGTLSEIVHVPDAARPVPGAVELLARLSDRLKIVAIVSGRSARDLVQLLGTDVEIWGTHGAERAVDGRVEIAERVRPYLALMDRVKNEARAAMDALGDPGVVLEDKTTMLGLHFRAARDVERARTELRRIADDLAARHDLEIAGGRLAYELRPPIELSKATVVLDRARETNLTAAAFAGDDRVDLPAFDALDALAREGVATLRIGVASAEAPEGLLERADVVVEGPLGTVAYLQRLASG